MAVIYENNIHAVTGAMEEAKKMALEIIGGKAESYAKQLCPVDTGRLRNSITHAVSGHPAAQSHYTADKPKNGKTNSGSYSGQAPDEKNKAVWIGTNVEYAPYVHDGTSKMSANRFLKKAATNYKDEYKGIIERELKS